MMMPDRVVLGLAALVGVLATWRLPHQWRGQDHVRRDPPHGFPLGPRGWRATLRSAPTVLAGWWLGVAIIAVDTLLAQSAASDAAVTLLVLLLVVDIVVVAAVVLVNRPAAVVPPPLRDAPGLLADRAGDGPA